MDRWNRVLVALFCLLGATVAGCQPPGPRAFLGTSSASAAVALDQETFVVADDESNLLRVYALGRGSLPTRTLDLSSFLAVDPQKPETDIEGAARVGKRIYWITSHGRNKDGQWRPGRCRFFATQIEKQKTGPVIKPVGRPCLTLVHQLLRTAKARKGGLEKSWQAGGKKKPSLAPKKQGLNIEGLCAGPDQKVLYIGFRNPLIKVPGSSLPMAMVHTLTNPAAVVEKGAMPAFGSPLKWNLGGLGIRAMEYSSAHGAIFIVAGPVAGGKSWQLFRWSGKPKEQPLSLVHLHEMKDDLTPESIFFAPGRKNAWLVSDDDNLMVTITDPAHCLPGKQKSPGKCKNKFLLDPKTRTFRLWSLALPTAK